MTGVLQEQAQLQSELSNRAFEEMTASRKNSALLDPAAWADEDLAMTDTTSRGRRRTWFIVAAAVAGLAIGILVSVATDVRFAPEVGLLVGVLVGWLAVRPGR